MSGLLIVFEGQDGAGKSTLLSLVEERLSKEGLPIIVVPEFSSNVLGEYLKRILEDNKFLRLNTTVSSALTETMYVLSDLYSQDELEIQPAIQQGKIVLKERHVDSVLACQIPKILEDYPEKEVERLLSWLKASSGYLTEPNLTFFLEVQNTLLQKRIKARGEAVSKSDFVIFNSRQEIYNHLATVRAGSWIVLSNNQNAEILVKRMVNIIKKHYNNLSIL